MNKNLIIVLSFFYLTANAQSTFSEVITVLENNGCSNGYCHGGGAGGFSLSGSEQEIYDNLVGVVPTNEAAASRGDKLIDPGYPERSFFYRKINQDLYEDSKLHSGEMDAMPPSGTLSKVDRELIRQWIYFGAPIEGKAFSDNVKEAFTEFHEEGGIEADNPPPAPAEGEGFQVHLGPFFLKPGDEIEFLKKHSLKLDEDLEVNRISAFLHPFSHHFILYKFRNQEVSDAKTDAMRVVSLSGENPFGTATELVAVWQTNKDFVLPEGTAFKWEKESVLDLNYHILNYSTNNVLAADVYFNVYTQPQNDDNKEMFSDLLLNTGIFIPNDGQETIHSGEIGFNGPINIWSVSSHTHKYGKDFDVYLEDENGEKGVQVFEGKFNFDYTVYTDYYDYAHPPFREFDKFLRLPSSQDLIHEAMFINDGPENVNFGLTTNDEMMITALLYTRGEDHQELAEFNELPTTVCITDEPFELLKNYESGAIGNGVIGNHFHPDFAGIGSHVILVNCCKGNEVKEFIVEVVPYTDLDLSFSIDNNTNPPTLYLDPVEISGPFSIQWYLNDQAIPNSNSDVVLAEQDGTYSAEIIIGNECPARTQSQSVGDVSGISEQNMIPFTVSPNPFRDRITVSYELDRTADVELRVVDLRGKLVDNKYFTNQVSGPNNSSFNLDVAPGAYFVSIIANGEVLGMQKILMLR